MATGATTLDSQLEIFARGLHKVRPELSYHDRAPTELVQAMRRVVPEDDLDREAARLWARTRPEQPAPPTPEEQHAELLAEEARGEVRDTPAPAPAPSRDTALVRFVRVCESAGATFRCAQPAGWRQVQWDDDDEWYPVDADAMKRLRVALLDYPEAREFTQNVHSFSALVDRACAGREVYDKAAGSERWDRACGVVQSVPPGNYRVADLIARARLKNRTADEENEVDGDAGKLMRRALKHYRFRALPSTTEYKVWTADGWTDSHGNVKGRVWTTPADWREPKAYLRLLAPKKKR